MRKPSVVLLILVVSIASVARADTIHLKNGSLLKGKVTSFADDQFVIMLDTGAGRFLSKAMVYIGDVARIEFDSAAGASAAAVDTAPSRDASTPEPLPSIEKSTIKESVARDIPSSDSQVRTNVQTESPAKVSPPAEAPRDTSTTESQPIAQPKEPEAQPDKSAEKPIEKPAVIAPTSQPTAEPEVEKAIRKFSGPVKTVSVDVVGKRDWTSSGLLVKRGDRIHISSTGTVTIDPGSGRTSGPEGLTDIADPKKLMPDQPTGALIGVIGADNDDFIFIGRSAEFTAARDGLLFLSVNEGTLSDNTGTYKATIEVQLQRK
jgi:hypothetical protein